MTPELEAFALWLAKRADDPDTFGRNLIALGDFNIDRRDDPNWYAFASSGLSAPEVPHEAHAHRELVRQRLVLRPDRPVPKRRPSGN